MGEKGPGVRSVCLSALSLIVDRSGRLALCRRPLQVQSQQPAEYVLVAEVARPAVGGEDGGGELLVGEAQPGRALVVEVSWSPLLQLRLGRARRARSGVPYQPSRLEVIVLLAACSVKGREAPGQTRGQGVSLTREPACL